MNWKLYSLAVVAALSLSACSGNAKSDDSGNSVNAEEFSSNQPLESGQYRAVSYDIEGNNSRKGKFDGRMLVSLSPDQSGIYVYENGNRAKIDYKIVISSPFEKGDSGVFKAIDVNGLPVVITTDSVQWLLGFEKSGNKIKIGFEPAPMTTGTPLEIMERISAAIKKNK